MGVWFDNHTSLELRCNGTLILGSKPKPDGTIGPWDNPWHVIDYAQLPAVARWVQTVTDSVATGTIDLTWPMAAVAVTYTVGQTVVDTWDN